MNAITPLPAIEPEAVPLSSSLFAFVLLFQRPTSVPSDFPPVLDGNCLKITGNLNKSKRKVVQELPIVGGKNTVFTLGGWAKGISLPGDNGKKPYFDLAISFKQKNGKYNDKKVSYLSFNKAQQGWQYAAPQQPQTWYTGDQGRMAQ